MADSRYVPGAEVIVSSLRRSVTQLRYKTERPGRKVGAFFVMFGCYFLVTAQESNQRRRHRGSDASAAGGRRSEQSEWQRSIADEGFSKQRKISGTATGMALSVALPYVPLPSRIAGKNDMNRPYDKYWAPRLGRPCCFSSSRSCCRSRSGRCSSCCCCRSYCHSRSCRTAGSG